ncbi:Calcineurin-like phosphoesterase [Teratosphaeria destructans]|uniref:Calcineurin-like phosphoesterase n=1 Tax=Teratosphaeria destructans TaxID=418781 RepID=A0A9W7SZX6_9PEZI|nr:Calcineurin-like phosphoesterase [Teratosphaeria destructans]
MEHERRSGELGGWSDEDDYDHVQPSSPRGAERWSKTPTHGERSEIYRYKGPIDADQRLPQASQTSRNHRRGGWKGPSRPLIDAVTNEWRREKSAGDLPPDDDQPDELRFCDLDDDESCPNITVRLLHNRRSRRMIGYLVAFIAVLYCAWTWYVQPQVVEEWETKEGFLPDRLNGTFGLAKMGDFHGTFLRQLSPERTPGGVDDEEGKRRLIFVGDIHGCRKEFLRLLEKVGPDSPGVLDELIRIKAESVRGNHEDRILEAAKALQGSDLQPQGEAATSPGSAKDHALLKSLTAEHMRYLRDMPLIIHIPALPQAASHIFKHKGRGTIATDLYVVHAGLVPHVPVHKQDPYFVMNMRSIDRLTHVPSALRQTKKGHSKPWIKIWNWYNERLSRGRSLKGFHVFTDAEFAAQQAEEEKSWVDRLRDAFAGWVKGRAEVSSHSGKKPEVVIYGHDSKSGLQIMKWSKGLDSACVSGGQLTAMVLDAAGRTQVVQVECEG